MHFTRSLAPIQIAQLRLPLILNDRVGIPLARLLPLRRGRRRIDITARYRQHSRLLLRLRAEQEVCWLEHVMPRGVLFRHLCV